jgi:RNA-directed DNA polymerase
VRANGGSPGVDGRSIDDMAVYLREHWPRIRDQVLHGTYQPQPVKRVTIPKPGGGFRHLGVPTVLDRLIQQAILQVLQPQWDPTFSEYSFGFRPGRSAHQAVAQAQAYVAEGYGWTVDIDLEKFFDQVNQDIMMGRAAKRISDKRLLKLLRAFLTAGVMENGIVSPTEAGTPQGSPLSPLLSNLILDELDQELTRRGLRFCRFVDDCNIYVRSQRAGERVMRGISRFLTKRLRLKINESKSAVAPVGERSFLGFCIRGQKKRQRHIAPKALQRFKARVRRLTRRTLGVSLSRMIGRLATYMRGWVAYFGFCQTPWVLHELDAWIRR